MGTNEDARPYRRGIDSLSGHRSSAAAGRSCAAPVHPAGHTAAERHRQPDKRSTQIDGSGGSPVRPAPRRKASAARAPPALTPARSPTRASGQLVCRARNCSTVRWKSSPAKLLNWPAPGLDAGPVVTSRETGEEVTVTSACTRSGRIIATWLATSPPSSSPGSHTARGGACSSTCCAIVSDIAPNPPLRPRPGRSTRWRGKCEASCGVMQSHTWSVQLPAVQQHKSDNSPSPIVCHQMSFIRYRSLYWTEGQIC